LVKLPGHLFQHLYDLAVCGRRGPAPTPLRQQAQQRWRPFNHQEDDEIMRASTTYIAMLELISAAGS
jgi:hypothetical protein